MGHHPPGNLVFMVLHNLKIDVQLLHALPFFCVLKQHCGQIGCLTLMTRKYSASCVVVLLLFERYTIRQKHVKGNREALELHRLLFVGTYTVSCAWSEICNGS